MSTLIAFTVGFITGMAFIIVVSVISVSNKKKDE